MRTRADGMDTGWKSVSLNLPFLFLCVIVLLCLKIEVSYGQATNDTNSDQVPTAPDKNATAEQSPAANVISNAAGAQSGNGPVGNLTASQTEIDSCDGIFMTYNFLSREKLYPHVKNISAQAWAFKSVATIMNVGTDELRGWGMFIGFQHREILVDADGAILMDAGDFPAQVGNGTILGGNPVQDLKTAIDTAGDLEQIQVKVQLKGTQFGLKPGEIPMPKTINLENDGYKCPTPKMRGTTDMYACCPRDPKAKAKETQKTRFPPRQNGDLTITYDVLQAYGRNYLAEVTIDNNHPLGRLDHWNLTWEWQQNEFISSMRGAYSYMRDPSSCLYGPAGKYYDDFDFSKAVSCDKSPIITDLPPERKEDNETGKLPYCCKNGTILPPTMDKEQARSIFQLQVQKLPPNDNRTSLIPPMKWNISGTVNPDYKCGNPLRVDATVFPDPTSGPLARTTAVASWQVVCNITRPKPKQNHCCASFSAFYDESVVPCPTCACGCPDEQSCNPDAKAMLLPPEAILVPAVDRIAKAKAWANIKHLDVPHKLPCPDNCGVSINWHVVSDFSGGWTARMTLFNWDEAPFDNWFAAVQLSKAYPGYDTVYSFNGTKLDVPHVKDTIFFRGLNGMETLIAERSGNRETDPRVPGKQQSVISFNKNGVHNFDVKRDGFPTKLIFNGEECALPTFVPKENAARNNHVNVLATTLVAVATLLLTTDRFY